jgi:hypothetical protein
MAKKGIKQSTESIEKRKATRKANDILLNRKYTPWNKGQTGIYSEETLNKLRYERSDETKAKIKAARANQIFSEESLNRARKNSSDTLKKQRTGKTLEEIYGEKRAKEIKNKQSASHIGKPIEITQGRIDGYVKGIETRSKNGSQGGGKSLFYETPVGKVQGKVELFYIEQLIKEGRELPKKPKGIKTPNGYYFPDFEYEDRFVEIKSNFTHDVFNGIEPNYNGELNTKQKEKATWVSKNIKQVEVIVYKHNEVINLYTL